MHTYFKCIREIVLTINKQFFISIKTIKFDQQIYLFTVYIIIQSHKKL